MIKNILIILIMILLGVLILKQSDLTEHFGLSFDLSKPNEKTIPTHNFNYNAYNTNYNDLFEYDTSSYEQHNKNLLNENPYVFGMNEYQNEKVFSHVPYGLNDDYGFSSDVYEEPVHINTNPLLSNATKWNNEMKPIQTLAYDDVNPLTADFKYNKIECGGLGNVCASDYDCCGGVFCYNNRCQQI